MTQNIYLVYKSQPQLGAQVYDELSVVLVNADSSANAITNAALAANQGFTQSEGQSEATEPNDTFYPKYFDTAVNVGTPPGSGNLSANGDAYLTPHRAVPIFVAGSSYTPVS